MLDSVRPSSVAPEEYEVLAGNPLLSHHNRSSGMQELQWLNEIFPKTNKSSVLNIAKYTKSERLKVVDH